MSKVGLDDFITNGATAEDLAALPRLESRPQLDPDALEGLAGRIVEAIDPFSEADPVATLAHVLVAVGNAVGPKPHCRVLHDRHPARLYAAIVGESGVGRKGLSWSAPRYLLEQTAPDWAIGCVHSGLSSGEGLIQHVRDARREQQPIRDHGKVTGYQEVLVDHGAEDKRAPRDMLTLKVYSERWLNQYVPAHCKPRTLELYSLLARRHLFPPSALSRSVC